MGSSRQLVKVVIALKNKEKTALLAEAMRVASLAAFLGAFLAAGPGTAADLRAAAPYGEGFGPYEGQSGTFNAAPLPRYVPWAFYDAYGPVVPDDPYGAGAYPGPPVYYAPVLPPALPPTGVPIIPVPY